MTNSSNCDAVICNYFWVCGKGRCAGFVQILFALDVQAGGEGRFDGGEIFCVSFHASAADFLSCRSSETKKPPFGGSAATTETTAGPRANAKKTLI
jgi:hypothetical protein